MIQGDILFQQYIDITFRNEVDEKGDAVFSDLLLDVVVLRDGTPRLVDNEELDAALSDGAITQDEYDLAKHAANKVMDIWVANKPLITKKLYEYKALFDEQG